MTDYLTTKRRPHGSHWNGQLTMSRLRMGDLLVKRGVHYFPLGSPTLTVSRQWVKDRISDGSIKAVADYVYEATKMK